MGGLTPSHPRTVAETKPGKRLRASEPSGAGCQEAAAWLAQTGPNRSQSERERTANCLRFVHLSIVLHATPGNGLIAPDHVQPRAALTYNTAGGLQMPSHVLLVEDDDGLRHAYVRILEQGGYVVHPHRDYVGVLELIDRQPNIGLLIVDVVMPAGTPHGVAIAGMVRQHYPGLPVVFLTGHSE
jgi:Response regulator receiver domain